MSVATHASPLSQIPPADPLGFDAGELSDQDLVEAMVEARRLASRVQAVELAAVAELARRRFAEAEDRAAVVEVLSPAEYVFDEVAEALTLTSTAADGLIRFATDLTGQLPGTFAALAAGEIDYLKARTIWHAIDQVDDRLVPTIEARALARAPEQTTGQIRAKIRRLIKRLDPAAAERRREEAEKHRGVELVETADGTAHLSGVDLPADAASAAYGRISAIATGLKRDGDDRGIDQLRADVYLGLLRGTFTPSEPPADTTDRPTPAPTMGDLGWTAIDDAIADVVADGARTELASLTYALNDARREDAGERHHDIGDLLAQAGARIEQSLTDLRTRWRLPAPAPGTVPKTIPAPVPGAVPGAVSCVVPDVDSDPGAPNGDGSDVAAGAACPPGTGGEARATRGVARYRPPAAMRRLIEHRDRRCVFPGCRRPARRCDADHTIPYHRGGATCPDNLAMICRRHHRLKATKGWRIKHLWPGVILWITPTGHWRITAPADRE